jgi:hypothetical protein
MSKVMTALGMLVIIGGWGLVGAAKINGDLEIERLRNSIDEQQTIFENYHKASEEYHVAAQEALSTQKRSLDSLHTDFNALLEISDKWRTVAYGYRDSARELCKALVVANYRQYPDREEAKQKSLQGCDERYSESLDEIKPE